MQSNGPCTTPPVSGLTSALQACVVDEGCDIIFERWFADPLGPGHLSPWYGALAIPARPKQSGQRSSSRTSAKIWFRGQESYNDVFQRGALRPCCAGLAASVHKRVGTFRQPKPSQGSTFAFSYCRGGSGGLSAAYALRPCFWLTFLACCKPLLAISPVDCLHICIYCVNTASAAWSGFSGSPGIHGGSCLF